MRCVSTIRSFIPASTSTIPLHIVGIRMATQTRSIDSCKTLFISSRDRWTVRLQPAFRLCDCRLTLPARRGAVEMADSCMCVCVRVSYYIYIGNRKIEHCRALIGDAVVVVVPFGDLSRAALP